MTMLFFGAVFSLLITFLLLQLSKFVLDYYNKRIYPPPSHLRSFLGQHFQVIDPTQMHVPSHTNAFSCISRCC